MNGAGLFGKINEIKTPSANLFGLCNNNNNNNNVNNNSVG